MTKLAYRRVAARSTHRLMLTWVDGRVTRTAPLPLDEAKRRASGLGELGLVVAIALERVNE
jgi:hypothetical protein